MHLAPRLELAPVRAYLNSALSFARGLRKGLVAAIVAWAATSLFLTVQKMEINMDAHVKLKVQGEAGVGVGPGLAKR